VPSLQALLPFALTWKETDSLSLNNPQVSKKKEKKTKGK
jgi:hypothetical protein